MTKKATQIGVGGLILTQRERDLVSEVLASSRLSYGPMSRRFEQQFSSLHGCTHGIFCNSGTSALHLAFTALREKYGWQDGDEVILPATTFIATANVVINSRLKPVFVDVQEDSFNLDPSKIEAAISPRTRALQPVHLLGLPADMAEILEIAERHDLAVVEDSCETMFVSYRGRSVGSLGDIGCFSTYVAHVITTGVGGIAISSNQALADIMRSLMNHGRDNRYVSIDDDKGLDDQALWDVVQSRYRFDRIGFSYRMTEIEAAIGIGQLEGWRQMMERRQAIAARLRAALAPYADRIRPQALREDRGHAHMVLGCLCTREGEAQRLIRYLERRNIETRPLFPLITQPAYKARTDLAASLPVSERLSRYGFYVGCHPYMADEDVDYVVAAIRAYFSDGGDRD